MLRAVRAACFHVAAERGLAERLAGADPERFHLVGEGVDPPPPGDAARFRRTHRVHDPFVLYAGRKAAEKNTPLLVEYFARYKLTHPQRPAQVGADRLGRGPDPGAPVRRHPRPRLRHAPGQGGRLRGDPGPLPAVAPRELLARHDGGVAGRRTLARPRTLRRDAGSLPRVERRPLLRGLLRVRRSAGSPRPGRRAPPDGWARPGGPTSWPTTRGTGSRTTTSPSSAAWAPASMTRSPSGPSTSSCRTSTWATPSATTSARSESSSGAGATPPTCTRSTGT